MDALVSEHGGAVELEHILAGCGIKGIHRCQDWGMAVLSVRAEITVWARRHGFMLTTPCTGNAWYPLWDVTEVAEVIMRCHEELEA
ncbi:hypothetical protein ACFQ07_31440 [Actinomadura adrarensis]|uniref:Uncharacterized protein n=1 Tax=Actinomadura adrarensis TaxID=1819600 RepID=A0ABW3CT86_9ACTN